MILPPSTHWIAAVAFERIFYCLVEGTALTAAVTAGLQLIRRKNSRTRFAVWFATLAAVVLLPLIPMRITLGGGASLSLMSTSTRHALVTLSSTWAVYIILAWAMLAGLGVLRVVTSLWHIRSLRCKCVPIDPGVLSAQLQATFRDFRKRRPVSVLVSSSLTVPTAIGFLRPAIVLPAWLADNSQAEELKYVLLHELAHLERWDDWTNLIQKLVKAVLFFHPGVWWIERKLSMDREMACDDAVLARTSSPRIYAQCLARVAERSFLQRQMALAQAAVDRVRQLSLRVSRILDANRPCSTRLWKPAIPMVAAVALLCAVSLSTTKDLVSVSDDHSAVAPSALASAAVPQTGGDQVVNSGVVANKSGPPLLNMAKFAPATGSQARVSAQLTSMKSHSPRSPFVAASYNPSKHFAQRITRAERGASEPASDSLKTAQRSTAVSAQDSEDGSHQYGVVLLVVTNERITSTGSTTWQVNMWELRLPLPANRPTKPVPRKS